MNIEEDKNELDEKTLVAVIASRLRSARQLAGYSSRRAFAKKHKLSISSYSHHEAGLTNFYAKDILKYSKLLNVSPIWLLTGKNSPRTPLEHRLEQQKDSLPILSIQGEVTTIDSHLFFRILQLASHLFKRVDLSNDYLLEYIIEIYNSLVTNKKMKQEDKLQSAELAITSLQKGIEIKRIPSKKETPPEKAVEENS